MTDADGVLVLADRLPPTLARHAAVALALVTAQIVGADELEALQARETQRERFVATVAHDLRTPLTGLSGYLDLILEGQRPGSRHRAGVHRAQPAHRRLDGRASSGICWRSRGSTPATSGSTSRPFSLAEVGGRVLAALAPLALERRIDLRVRPAVADARSRRRPARGPTDPDEPPGQCPEVHSGRRPRRAGRLLRWRRRDPGRARRWAGDRRRRPRADLRTVLRVDAQAP